MTALSLWSRLWPVALAAAGLALFAYAAHIYGGINDGDDQ